MYTIQELKEKSYDLGKCPNCNNQDKTKKSVHYFSFTHMSFYCLACDNFYPIQVDYNDTLKALMANA